MCVIRCVSAGLLPLLFLATDSLSQERGKETKGGASATFGSRDPEEFFRGLAKGKDVIIRSELDPQMQGLFDFIAKKANVTDGRITLQQFRSLSANKEEGNGNKRRTPAPASAPTMPAPNIRSGNAGESGRSFANPANMANWADDAFTRADSNHDGVLDYNEMQDDLRDTLDTWDDDSNGFIDLGEFREYHVARLQQKISERDEEGLQTPWSKDGQGKKPLVYSKSNLPANMPSWFSSLDENEDAQVTLREWRQDKKKSLDEFVRMDRNNDGFLTVEEIVRHQTRGTNGGKTGQPVRDEVIVRGGSTPPANPGNANGGERRNWPRGGNSGAGGERRMTMPRPGGERESGDRRRPGGDRERRNLNPSGAKPTDK